MDAQTGAMLTNMANSLNRQFTSEINSATMKLFISLPNEFTRQTMGGKSKLGVASGDV